jgi:hypothetical protein
MGKLGLSGWADSAAWAKDGDGLVVSEAARRRLDLSWPQGWAGYEEEAALGLSRSSLACAALLPSASFRLSTFSGQDETIEPPGILSYTRPRGKGGCANSQPLILKFAVACGCIGINPASSIYTFFFFFFLPWLILPTFRWTFYIL